MWDRTGVTGHSFLGRCWACGEVMGVSGNTADSLQSVSFSQIKASLPQEESPKVHKAN